MSDIPKRALHSGVRSDTIMGVVEEVDRARKLFPEPEGLMAALGEEVGELFKAIQDESAQRIKDEAVQVAAMAIRVMEEGDPILQTTIYSTKI